ncbi:ras-related protein Rab-37-like isoform X1 [Formica exsecta]|uniref:ras-related protein Rab-37-like isoform X1 n=1 Tax=Formica exsecta TaxID=72781 RepID=UPI001142881A|nr:ras-related protein Rab-37-like isoform X1 [Formica exsecta]
MRSLAAKMDKQRRKERHVAREALLLLYDVTNKTSYDNIRAWLSEIREHANEDVVIMLLGNKSDCGTERIVKREDGERLAQEYKVPFMETSAKTGLNVELAFLAVARDLKARKSDNPDETKFNVQDYVRQQSQRNTCFNSSCLTT